MGVILDSEIVLHSIDIFHTDTIKHRIELFAIFTLQRRKQFLKNSILNHKLEDFVILLSQTGEKEGYALLPL